MKPIHSLVALASLLLCVAATTSLGCFSSVKSDKNAYNSFQSVDWCSKNLCLDYAYIAFNGGGTCYCLSSFPLSGLTDDDSCDVGCNGYGLDMCGGARAYNVYAGPGTIGAGTFTSLTEGDNSASASGTLTSTTSLPTLSTQSTSATLLTSTSASKSTNPDSSQTPSLTLITSTVSASSSASETTTESSSSSPSTSLSATATSTTTSSPDKPKSKSSTNVGAIVGGVVGGIAGIAAIAVAVFLFMRFKNRDDDDDDEGFNYDTKAVLRGPLKNSRANPLDMPMTNPFTHPSDAQVAAGAGGGQGLVDPRLNPVMMGRRRLSEGSLADEADYSRKILQVANPG